jgi:TorA maturation chaperone TorD
VLTIYRTAGLDKSHSWKDGEDHIALELDFERMLCTRALQALRKGDETTFFRSIEDQHRFLINHLLNWVPAFANDMHKFAKTDFYKALAYLTIGFLENDKEFLEDVLANASEDRPAK